MPQCFFLGGGKGHARGGGFTSAMHRGLVCNPQLALDGCAREGGGAWPPGGCQQTPQAPGLSAGGASRLGGSDVGQQGLGCCAFKNSVLHVRGKMAFGRKQWLKELG